MKKIYVCSPMRGNLDVNRLRAKEYAQMVYRKGFLPIAPQIYLEEATGLLEERGHRDELLVLGKELLKLCDELWIFGDRISEGMKEEIALAKKLKIKVFMWGYK